jgi:hypothetical protein
MTHTSQLIEPSERTIFDPDLITKVEETAHRIQSNLMVVKSRQESYANKKCRSLQFEAEDHVYLRVSPTRCLKRFGIKGKLAPVTSVHSLFVIPRSEIAGTKPPYVCLGCFIHTYSNKMINKFHV